MISEVNLKKRQSIYTPFWLKLYNIWVLDISNRWIWRCLKQIQLEQFNQFVSSKHLDIGVGTGYYLYACQSSSLSQLSLMDLNPNCLKFAENTLKRRELNPAIYQENILKPQPKLAAQFTSISMNYLLHCLPGNMRTKEACIANAVAMLLPGGILFGATILADEAMHTKTSRSLANFYNKKGIFSNQDDKLAALKIVLNNHLREVQVKVVGCVALFNGVRG